MVAKELKLVNGLKIFLARGLRSQLEMFQNWFQLSDCMEIKH